MEKIRIGVIGLGKLGYQHAMNITQSRGAVLAAVSDVSETALKRAVKDFGVKGYKECEDMIRCDDVEALVVAAPTKMHFDILMKCIEAEKPIFVEKPITYTVEEAEKIIEEVEKRRLYLQVGFMRRFDQGHMASKTMIAEGKCGKPIYIHNCQRDPNSQAPEYVPENGGLFVDMGIHDLDVSHWLMGREIVKNYGQGASLKHEYLKNLNDIDNSQVLLKLGGGAQHERN